MNEVKLIGIAGGSGAGKSTLCLSLKQKFPDLIEIIQLDQYFKPEKQIPVYKGYANREHPKAIDFERLNNDLASLKQGKPLVMNRNDTQIKLPKSIVLVEGFLLLWNKSIRDKLDLSVFLDLSSESRLSRRKHSQSADYKARVLNPMHEKFVAPTKKYADLVIGIDTLDKNSALTEFERFLFSKITI